MRVLIRLLRGGEELARRELTTDGDGIFEFRASAGDAPAEIHATVTSASFGSYDVPRFDVTPVTRRGEATVLEPWTRIPYVYHEISILLDGEPLVHADVRFVPSGGVVLPGEPPWSGRTNGAGVFEIPLQGSAVGEVTGPLTVEHPLLSAPYVAPFSVPVGHTFVFPLVRGTIVLYR